MIEPPLPADHRACGVLDGQEDAVQVDRHHFAPVLEGQFGERAQAADAGVGDGDVDAAVPRQDTCEQLGDLGFVADVACGRLSAVDFCGGCCCGVLRHVGDDDSRFLGGEFFGDRAPDAACSSGNHCNFSFELP